MAYAFFPRKIPFRNPTPSAATCFFVFTEDLLGPDKGGKTTGDFSRSLEKETSYWKPPFGCFLK